MGVSVSASTAIIVAGLFFAFTAFYPVAANGFDRVTDAQHGVHERSLERQNTDFTVENATYDGATSELTIDASNDGAVGLVVTDATLVVGNEYVDLGADATATAVDGDGDTELWLGGEELTVTLEHGTDFDTAVTTGETRVILVVESGVRDAATVTEVS
ncbi:flagellin [Halorubrum aidingense JCM 13560]|uniref:Flagellin n=1 Tax=Halorubrum aidingense JCM 13560 TaxID=1230454 RepID=M0P742_9EURY|nr:flagellin [Halorubrum aidingense]EMA65962.1 flagellin [Halorubrum aidingense JCM 13560]